MTKEQIPSLNELASPGVMELVAQRPRAADHMATGRYGDLIAGWRAQAALVRARLAAEARARIISIANGQELRELAEAELMQQLPDVALPAVGEAILTRTVTNENATHTFPPGVFPTGFRLRKEIVVTDLAPPQEPATYHTTAPVYVTGGAATSTDNGDGTYTHTIPGNLALPIECDVDGPVGNVASVPAASEHGKGTLVDAPFDNTFVVSQLRAAGGTTSRTDTQLRAIARVAQLGQLGPNGSAILLGALSHPGVHYAHYQEDQRYARGILWVADGQWGYSEAFLAAVKRTLDDDWICFGGKVSLVHVRSQAVVASLEVTLRDPAYLRSATDIEAAIRGALEKRLSNEHWYTWSTDELRGVVAAADRRVLSVDALDLLHQGAAIGEPDPVSELSYEDPATRWFLGDGGIHVTFSA